MKLKRVKVSNFGTITGPVEIDFDGGLTVIHGPNEVGKSTLMKAMEYCLTWPATSQATQIKNVVPHSGGTPEVAATLERNGTSYRMEKSFGGASGTASLIVKTPNGSVQNYSGGEADEVLREALGMGEASGRVGTPEHTGMFSSLWVSQTEDLEDPGGSLQNGSSRELSETLGEVTGEVLAGTGGTGVVEEVEQRYLKFYSESGNPRRGSSYPLVQAEDRVHQAQDKVEELWECQATHKRRVERYRSLEQEIEALSGEELPELRDAARRAEEEAEEVEDCLQKRVLVEARLETAKGKLERVEGRLDKRETLRSTLEELAAKIDTLDEERERLESSRDEERGRASELGEAVEEAREAVEGLRRRQRRAKAKAEELQLESRVEELDNLLDEVGGYVEEYNEAVAGAESIELEQSDVEGLRELKTARDEKRAELRAAAARIEYEAHRDVALEVDGERFELKAGEAGERRIDRDVTVDVGDLIELRVRPGGEDLAGLREQVDEAEEAFDDALERAGVKTVGEASREVARLGDLESDKKRLNELIQRLTPNGEGLEALERRLAIVKEQYEKAAERVDASSVTGDEPLPDEEAACRALENELEDRLDDAREELADAKEALAAHSHRLERLDERLEQVSAELQATREERSEKKQALEQGIDELGDDAALEMQEQHAKVEVGEKSGELESLEERLEALNAEQVERRVERTVRAVQKAEEELDEKRQERAALEAKLSDGQLLELHDDIARAEAELQRAEAEAERLGRRAEVLEMLYETLVEARTETRERYMKPLSEAVGELMAPLFDDVTVDFDSDFNITKVSRGHTGEDFDQLSVGTRGQVGIIVRLAMAKVLAEEGEAPPVFLDDALTDSDDQRFEVMVDLLDGLSEELQIVVATCHWSRFRKLGAASVDLERKSVDSR